MQSEPVVILVVDDDPAIQDVVMDALSEGGFEAAVTQSGEEAVTLCKRELPRIDHGHQFTWQAQWMGSGQACARA